MEINFQFDTQNINWDEVIQILKINGMGFQSSLIHKKAFENSYIVVFVFDANQLIGFGRAISDGVYQAAIYDVAVLPDYQGKGIGKKIINCIVEKNPECNYILYASPGKEMFYQKLQFRKMKTGMAMFMNESRMLERGFIE